MGHILFGLPEIQHFHLHSRLARKLAGRDHRVTTLHEDPVSFDFFANQGMACVDWRPQAAPIGHFVPVQEFAARQCRIEGHPEPSRGRRRRATRRLEQRIVGLMRIFERDPPDLVMLYEGRSGLHRMLHFMAQQHGAKVMHVGRGLLPMTLQVDADGIDGDGSLVRWTPQDYRRGTADEEFLHAATAAWLGRAYPPPLARLGVAVPPVLGRLIASASALWRGQWRVGLGGCTAWDKAYRLRWPRVEEQPTLPDAPFVALMLQEGADPRLRLDAPECPSPGQLIQSTWQAVQRLDPAARLLVVLPRDKRVPARLTQRFPAVHFVPKSAGALAVATAMAIVTVNHPLGLAGILVGSPVLHTGRTPYGIPGVAVRTDGSDLYEHLSASIHREHPALRRRFLTRILKENHVWCPAAYPDSNGVAGLARWMERAIGSPRHESQPLRYRPGPVWPLAVDGERRRRL